MFFEMQERAAATTPPIIKWEENPKWSLYCNVFIKLLILKTIEKLQTLHIVWYIIMYTFSLRDKFANNFFFNYFVP